MTILCICYKIFLFCFWIFNFLIFTKNITTAWKISKSIFFPCTLERLKTPKKAFLALFERKILNFFTDIFDIFRYFAILADIPILLRYFDVTSIFLPIFFKFWSIFYFYTDILTFHQKFTDIFQNLNNSNNFLLKMNKLYREMSANNSKEA